ncbi:hypothetical protein N566_23020 [Streptomycetaceae bacterium MP113-05]|nr:hypothetical protein N566_23020 [Streptomycetaceae bacterium MP113-05]
MPRWDEGPAPQEGGAATTPTDDRAVKAAHREMWALGDYPKVARSVTHEFGPRLVRACGSSPGQRVLDVATGAGSVAIRAAEAGADVTASDLTLRTAELDRDYLDYARRHDRGGPGEAAHYELEYLLVLARRWG